MASGFIVPLSVLPATVAGVARWTPFPSMVQTTVDIAVERHTGLAALTGLAVQAGWVVLLLVLAWWLVARATRRVVVQGG